jgi:hypothetical protein
MLQETLGQQVSAASNFKYSEVHEQLRALLNDWRSVVNTGGVTVTDTGSTLGATSDQFKGEEVTSRIRRELRRDNRDLPIMRARGEVPPEGNYIPRRVIDRQISQEKPNQISFIEQPDRLLIFKDLTDTENPTEDLEHAFTTYMRYPGWTIPWHRAFDGMDLHGGVCLEVKVDPSKPFRCAIEYIRREDLIFACEATEIQGNEYIMRRYRYMPFEVESFVRTWNFNPAAVKEILANSEHKRHQKVEIFKCWTKKEGIVYIFWYSEKCQQSFLKDPEMLDLGIKDPNEIELYTQSVRLYENMQQAVTVISKDQQGQSQGQPPQAVVGTSSSGTSPMENLGPELGGSISESANSQPPPESGLLLGPPPVPPASLPEDSYPVFFLPYEVIEDDRLLASKGLAFRHRSDQEAVTELWTGLINAVNKAKDVYGSYVNNPNTQEGLNSADKLIPNTIMAREVKFWNFPFPDALLLGTAQAFENNISANSNRVDFAALNRSDTRKTAEEIRAAGTAASQQMSVGISGQSLTILGIYELCWRIGRSFTLLGEVPTFPIPKDRLLHKYVLASAGDSDVVRRDQRKQIIRETFQYVQGTPIGNQFLEYLVKTFFPEEARKWIPVLESQDPLQLIQVAYQLLLNTPRDTLTPEQNTQLEQILGLFQQYISARTGQANIPGGPSQLANASNNPVANNLPKEQGGSASGSSGG